MPKSETHTWPVGLRRLAEVIGPAAAVRLADQFGGVERLYVPKTPRPDHALVPIIGFDKLADLCSAFGGLHIDIPRGTFKDLKKVQILDAEGSARAVALRLRVSQRYVRKVRHLPQGADLFSHNKK